MSPPIVALHGFTGTPRAFAPLGVSIEWAPFLAGHGSNPHLGGDHFEDEVTRLSREIRRRFSGPVHLLGYSMGARVGLGLLCAAPELFHSATLLGLNPGLETEEARQERLAWEARWIDILEQDGLAVFEHRWRSQPLFKSQDSLPPRSQDAQRSERLSHSARGLSHALSVLGLGSMPNHWPRIPELRVSTTLVTGGLDEKFERISDRLMPLNSVFRRVSLADVGHNPLLECPELVGTLLRDTVENSPA